MLRIETLCLGLAASLSVLACGDDSPGTRGDSGQSATASDASTVSDLDAGSAADATVAPDGSPPGASPGGDAASKPDSGADSAIAAANLSCEQLTQAAGTALRGALEAGGSCSRDTDCKSFALSTACSDSCSGIAPASVSQALQSVIEAQNGSTCAVFKERGCKAIIPPCKPPAAPACIAGECRDYHGSLPVSGPGGGASVAVAVLDNPASPARGDLTAGQRLELTLRSVGAGAYTEPTLSAVALRFVESFLPRLQNPGGPTKVFVFEAVSPGTVQISIPHSTRPDAFNLTVTIR